MSPDQRRIKAGRDLREAVRAVLNDDHSSGAIELACENYDLDMRKADRAERRDAKLTVPSDSSEYGQALKKLYEGGQ